MITIDDLKGVYSAAAHPKVQRGEMTEEEVFLQFLNNFGDVNNDGTIVRAVITSLILRNGTIIMPLSAPASTTMITLLSL